MVCVTVCELPVRSVSDGSVIHCVIVSYFDTFACGMLMTAVAIGHLCPAHASDVHGSVR